jgi:hypothetical protein
MSGMRGPPFFSASRSAPPIFGAGHAARAVERLGRPPGAIAAQVEQPADRNAQYRGPTSLHSRRGMIVATFARGRWPVARSRSDAVALGADAVRDPAGAIRARQRYEVAAVALLLTIGNALDRAMAFPRWICGADRLRAGAWPGAALLLFRSSCRWDRSAGRS